MSSKSREKDSYLKQYPEAKRWLNQCIICQSIGYKPGMPENITPGYMAENIRSLLPELMVNDLNICDQCQENLKI